MRLPKTMRPEACCATDASRYGIQNPWILHAGTGKATVYATDGRCAVRIPVDPVEGDTDGQVPVEALKAARKGKRWIGRGETKRAVAARVDLNGGADVIDESKPKCDWAGPSFPREDASFPDVDSVVPPPYVADAYDVDNDVRIVAIDAERLLALARAMGTDKVRLTLRFDKAKGEHTGPVRVDPVWIDDDEGAEAHRKIVGERDPDGAIMLITEKED